MFDADRPIQKNEQDRLGRTTFAKYLARCILDHKNPESLVIGISGGWGTGKTSIINLMIEELNFASSNMFDIERPILLNFSPWSYSGQNQLIYAFFRRLSSMLRQSPYLENKENIIRLLELYISFFTNKPIPKALQRKKTWLSRLFRVADEDAHAWESGRDLTQVKAELNELLLHQQHKIIIVIDNISRIDAIEMRQIFQIVKSIGDFNNTIYLLSLDKEYVSHVLGEGSEEYLEKLIQLPFEVPAISKQDLENILFDRLKPIILQIPEDAWQTEYWADIYYSTIKFFFESCRDITRYINTLSFGFARVKDVVNPVDFFAITALRVFEPEVYYGIRDNKDLFADLIDNVYQLHTQKLGEDKIRCEEILKRAETFPRDLLLTLLLHLFPRLRAIYQPTITFYHSDALARKNKRVCSPDVFDIYFRLSMPSGHIADSEMNAILAATHNEEEFSQALLRLNQDDRITKFLDLLDGVAINKIAVENIHHVINALMDSADLFAQGETNLLKFNTPMRIHRIFHQLLRRLPTTTERFAIYRDAISSAKNSLYIIIHELSEQEKEHIETEDTYIPLEHRDFTSGQLQELQKLAVGKIIYWAELGRLVEHPKLLPILYAWKKWGNKEACTHYVIETTKNDRGIVAFLYAALQEPVEEAISKQEKNSHWQDSLKNIEAFVSPDIIEPHAKELFEDLYFEKLREREQLAILIFLDLIKSETMKIIPKTTA